MINKNKIVLIFPGQGSQYTGMGLDYLDLSHKFKDYFKLASDILKEDLTDIVFDKNGAGFKLENTLYSQISIFTLSAVISDYLLDHYLKKDDIFAVTGHSLGDYSALYTGGYFSFKQSLDLVKYRGNLMAEANEKMDGMMAAILGTDYNSLNDLLIKFKGRYKKEVYIANYNDYSQIVISGIRENMEKAIEFLKENGIKKVIPLKVRIASHTPLMMKVSRMLGDYVKSIMLQEPFINFYSSTSQGYCKKEEIWSVLKDQLTSQINWVKTIEYFLNEDVNVFVETGPSKVLSGLVKRIADKNQKDILIFNTDRLSDLNNLKNFLS
ncbi:MAG: ACP S-malonyltransferase [Actinobacteria bacterium]|nr:ACP S-malonyltransferase [Actinomycetota bacterium]MCL6087002.1 ACP S-malonyltransferase [Actinomycetota bacterium]